MEAGARRAKPQRRTECIMANKDLNEVALSTRIHLSYTGSHGHLSQLSGAVPLARSTEGLAWQHGVLSTFKPMPMPMTHVAYPS